MKPTDTEVAKLVAQTFHDDWETGDPLRYARDAAKYARHRHTIRKLVVVASCLLLLAGTLITIEPIGPRAGRQIGGAASNYTVVSDAELLAQVHDRPLLALRNGEQVSKLIVLENDASQPAARSEP